MLASIFRLAVWLLLALTVIVLAWDEPLRYKFMTDQQIAEEEAVYQPKPKKKTSYQDWDSSSLLLHATPAPGGSTRQRAGYGRGH